MSRAFTKEDGWQEPVVPPRAALPPGTPNYVTPRGLARLHEERAALEAERAGLDAAIADEDARRTRRTVLAAMLGELAARIANAELVDPTQQAHDRARFGARVTLAGREARTFQVVGVDEANPDAGTISFLAPLAQAVLGKQVGDVVEFRGEKLRVEAVEYDR